jgi:cobalt-zinc-cadmium efflux system protein
MSHDHHHHHVSAGARHRRPLAIALALTAGYMLVQFVVGFSVGSLALISDAGHMLTDTVGLAMALLAITVAQRSTSDQQTYGRYRLEAFAALGNALLLFGVAIYVLYEAVGRFRDPSDVPGLGLIVVATIGLLVNVCAFLLLQAGASESINVRGAFLEVVADMIGSVGVLLAGAVMLLTAWPYADPIVGVAIGLFVLPRAYRLGRDALRILMERAPDDVSVVEVQAALAALPGVADVHDLHVWTLTSGTNLATAHLRLRPGATSDAVVPIACATLHREFNLQHVTVQAEADDGVPCAPVI